jgi:nucleoside-diphosphate-sugar epimerase
MKHIVVTGGSGFVGSHLCEEFLDRGYAVTALDNLVTGRVSNLRQAQRSPQFAFIEMDVSVSWDHPLLLKRIKDLGVHGV